MSKVALGIDIGGTHVRAGLVRGDGALVDLTVEKTPTGGDPRKIAEMLAAGLRDRAAQPASVEAIVLGVALPGIWDRATGLMQRALNLPKLEGVNCRELFEHALGGPVVLENDVIAAGYAQWRAHRHRRARFTYLSIGTGVAGCVVLDGAVVRHTRGGPGHLGHLIVDTSPDAPACRCGARGCLEAAVGGVAAGRTADDRAARALAIGMMQIANVYAPDVIALGGGVIEGDQNLLLAAREMFITLRGSLSPPGLEIVGAPLPSDEAGVIGAALLALEQSRRSSSGVQT